MTVQNNGLKGVDLNSLANLPHELRGRAIHALADLQDAVALNNANKAADASKEIKAIIAKLEEGNAETAVNKMFVGAPAALGTHDVAKFFAKRAGVTA